MEHSRREVLEADDAYTRMAKRGFWYRLWAMIRQKPYRLWNLNMLSSQWVRARYSAGAQLVPLAAIQGSEGKESAFDRGFHPTTPNWSSIAINCNE
jgi:hypothetical protein